jgi:transcriptional regulator with XRE-family HTH domain
MTGKQLRELRERHVWTQVDAARRSGVSQPYWSLMERGLRPVPRRVVAALLKCVDVPATALSVNAGEPLTDAQSVASRLAALGYPGFAYLARGASRVNPARLLVDALRQPYLEARVVAALPWVLVAYPDLDWHWLLDQAKRDNLQNRLGFLLGVAQRVAELQNASTSAERFSGWLRVLDDARLVREDTFAERLTEAERRFLREQRSELARHWNMLTGMRPEHLSYVA